MKAFTTFQFTPLREGRRRSTTPLQGLNYFNSRPSARGDCNMAGINTPDDIFQFTPLREGRRQSLTDFATVSGIFQFTPLREGRRHRGSVHVRDWHFNSRPSARGDGEHFARNAEHLPISIHAPPRGATCWPAGGRMRRNNFNSRPSARGDVSGSVWNCSTMDFNSRPSARGDGMVRCSRQFLSEISIHAPPRGATQLRDQPFRIYRFQFTPLREGRQRGVLRRPARLSISIHAPPRGATILPTTVWAWSSHFNSRPSARGDKSPFRRTATRFYFNSRPSARGDTDTNGVLVRSANISIHAPPRGATSEK